MIIGKKALIGILGIGTAAAALGWMFLPKNSKLRKTIGEKARHLGGVVKDHVDDVLHVTGEKSVRPAVAKK